MLHGMVLQPVVICGQIGDGLLSMMAQRRVWTMLQRIIHPFCLPACFCLRCLPIPLPQLLLSSCSCICMDGLPAGCIWLLGWWTRPGRPGNVAQASGSGLPALAFRQPRPRPPCMVANPGRWQLLIFWSAYYSQSFATLFGPGQHRYHPHSSVKLWKSESGRGSEWCLARSRFHGFTANQSENVSSGGHCSEMDRACTWYTISSRSYEG